MFENLDIGYLIVSVIDILLVAIIFYFIMRLVRGTRAERMMWGLGLLVIVFFVSEKLKLYTLHWILSGVLSSIVIIIVVVFQQEIRRALTRMGTAFAKGSGAEGKEFLEEIATAVSKMVKSKIGGLIVIQKKVDLSDLTSSGTVIRGEVSKELILSIFNIEAPLHDGAVIIADGLLYKAGVILPLTDKHVRASMGTRHRAALGITEETDAIAIVVSEQTGEVSLSVGDMFEVGLDNFMLLDALKEHFIETNNEKKGIFSFNK